MRCVGYLFYCLRSALLTAYAGLVSGLVSRLTQGLSQGLLTAYAGLVSGLTHGLRRACLRAYSVACFDYRKKSKNSS